MIAFLLLLAAKQGDIAMDLQQSIQKEALGSPAFKKSVSQVLAKHGIEGGKFQAQRTIGDKRGLMLTAHSVTPDENKYPVWWRIYVWPEGPQNRVQLIKKAELYLEGGTFTEGEVYWRGDQMVIAGSEVNGGTGEHAALSSYRYVNGKWKLVQHLVDKREGFAKIARNQKSVDPTIVRVITRDWTKNLRQPHVGPLLRYEAVWKLVGGSYKQGKAEQVYTPLAELETLSGLVAANDRATYDRRVKSKFASALWNGLKLTNSVESITSNSVDSSNMFQFANKGPKFAMERVNGRWTIISWEY